MLFGGPLAGVCVVLDSNELVFTHARMFQPHPGGPYCQVMRTGRYCKFALVPTAALWT